MESNQRAGSRMSTQWKLIFPYMYISMRWATYVVKPHM